MRILPNLNDINECPNCGSPDHLRETENEFGRHYLVCINCHEELFEDEDTCYDVGEALNGIDDNLMDIEYAASDLTRYATTQQELEQMERIRNIFDELISVIRRMK